MTTPDDLEKEIQAIHEEFGKRLLVRLRGRLGDVADDAYQDALLAVYVERRKGKVIDRPEAYLHRAAWHAAIDIIRKLRRSQPDSEFLDQVIDHSDAFAVIETAALVRSAIRRLPMTKRRV